MPRLTPSKVEFDALAQRVADLEENALMKSGGTMTGTLRNKFGAMVGGASASSATTVPTLASELRYKSFTCGSFNTSAAYTLSGVTAPAGWYNYIWIPHRDGSAGAEATNTDNVNYGTLLLYGMTVDTAPKVLRYANGALASMKNM